MIENNIFLIFCSTWMIYELFGKVVYCANCKMEKSVISIRIHVNILIHSSLYLTLI